MDWENDQHLHTVRLFPLPNVVLFPRAVLPLHIFEDRYKEMVADALSDDRLIAMALLKPGWEKNYHARPEIDPVVCVGRILQHEQLADGRYNLLLQGEYRAKVVEERKSHPYRTVRVAARETHELMEIDLTHERERLASLFESPAAQRLPRCDELQRIVSSPLPTDDVADLISFMLLDDVDLKQSLLSDWDVRARVARVIHAVECAMPPAIVSAAGYNDASLN